MASIQALHQELITKERSAQEITEAALETIHQLEPKLHSFWPLLLTKHSPKLNRSMLS